MRRFAFQEDATQKFWEVEVAGAQLTVRFGKLGNKGQTKTKTLESAEAAQAEEAQLIKEKTGKGYLEIGTPVAPVPKPVPAAPQTIRTALRAPSGIEFVLTLQGSNVFTGEGDQRVTQTLDSPAEARAHFQRVLNLRRRQGFTVIENQPVKPVAVAVSVSAQTADVNYVVAKGRCTITFKGSADKPVPAAVCEGLVVKIEKDAPTAVQLICDFGFPKHSWEHALAGKRLPSVEAFIFDTHFQSQTRQRKNSIGDLAGVLDSLPGLQRFFATGDLELTASSHPTLSALHLVGSPLAPSVISAIGASKLPALERLVLSLASDSRKTDDAAVLEALLALKAPKLREIHLNSITDVPSFVEQLALRGLPRSLKILSLCGTSEGAYPNDVLHQKLQKHAAALGALQSLCLALDDDLPSLRAAFPFVSGQDEHGDLFLPKAYEGW